MNIAQKSVGGKPALNLIFKNWSKDNKFILFGAAQNGWKVYEIFRMAGKEKAIEAIVDNNKDRQGLSLGGIEICSPEIIKHKGITVILCASPGTALEMKKNLPDIQCAIMLQDWYNVYSFHCFKETPKQLKYPLEQTARMYLSWDGLSAELVHLHYALIDSPLNLIQPLEQALSFTRRHPMNENYWSDSLNSLGCYSDISFLDLGAYDGASLANFYFRYGDRVKSAMLFEPNPEISSCLSSYISKSAMAGRASVHSCLVGQECSHKNFLSMGASSKASPDGGYQVEMVSLDSLNLDDVKGQLCIKMDIEGQELEALKGAETLIKKYKPEMAVCVYHKINDLYEIPALLRTFVPDYEFILRGGPHMVLYASANGTFKRNI